MVNIKMGYEKTLWQRYNKWFLSLLFGFLLIYGSGQYYQYYQNRQTLKASFAYDKMITAMQKQDKATAEQEGQALMSHFGKTPYASLGALLLAKLAVEENHLNVAKEHLQFALKHGNESIQSVAKVRLARILAEEKDYEVALSVLSEGTPSQGYQTLIEETKGDIYLLQNDKEKARAAYQAALNVVPPGIPTTRLQLKQAELGVVVKEGA